MAEPTLGGISAENAAEIVKLTKDISDIQEKITQKQEEYLNASKKNKKILREELSDMVKQNKELKTRKDILAGINDLVDGVVDSTDKEAMLNYDILGSKTKLEKINKSISKLNAKAANSSKDEQKKILKQVAQLQQKLGLAESVVERNIDAVKSIQAQQQITDKLLGNLNLSVKALGDMKDQAKMFAEALFADKRLALLALLAGAAIALKKAVDFGKRFRDELGFSLSQSKDLTAELSVTQLKLKAIGADGVKITQSLVENFGTLDAVSAKTVMSIGKIEKGLGIAPEYTAKTMKNMMAISGFTQEQALEQVKLVGQLAKANKVAPNDIMKDLADNTEFFATYANDGGKNLAQAAVEAKKLGVNLSTTAKIADSLLDFESSIEKELEAALLTGKQINYNKARQLALEGDVAGAAKEVVKQIGGQEEFNRMNAIQRKALADSIGVSVEELSRLSSGKPMKLEPPDTSNTGMDFDPLRMATTENTGAVVALTGAIGAAALGSKMLGLDPGKFGGKGFFNRGKSAPGPLTKAGKPDMRFSANKLAQETLKKKAGGGLLSKAGGLFGKGMGLAKGIGGKALGGAGALIFGGMDIAKGLKSGDSGKTGAGLGSIIGTGLGAIGGVPGMMLGGMAGNFIGEKIGGMFNRPKANEPSAFRTPKTDEEFNKANEPSASKTPKTDAEFNKERLDSMKSGDGRFSSVPISMANRETTTQLQNEFGDLTGGQQSSLLQSINDGSFEQRIVQIIERMPEMMANATNQNAAKETEEFIEVLKGIRENTGKTYTEIGNMIAE